MGAIVSSCKIENDEFEKISIDSNTSVTTTSTRDTSEIDFSMDEDMEITIRRNYSKFYTFN